MPDVTEPTLPAVHELAVHELGGVGAPVVYAHATGFHAHCWTPVTDLLPDLHNLAYDARGHGDTPADPDWVVDWATYGTDAEVVAGHAAATYGPLLGVGHSMGGAALLMAALASPRSFTGLVVYEPIAMPRETAWAAGPATEQAPNNFLAIGARRRRSSFGSFDDAIANYSAKPPLNVFTAAAIDAYVRFGFAPRNDGRVHLRCRPEHEARTYEAGGAHGTWERLGDLRLPVWVVCGKPEPLQPSSRMELLAGQIPGARYIHIDHLGHFGPMQAPAEIAAIVAAASAAFSA